MYPRTGGGGPIMPQSRVVGVPLLVIDAAPFAEALFADALDASPISADVSDKLAIHIHTSRTASYSLAGEMLEINANGQPFIAERVPERFAYFLGICESLSVWIRSDNTQTSDYMVTVKDRRARNEPPLVAVSRPGGKNRGLLEVATNWTKWMPADPGYFVGFEKVFTRTYTYEAAAGNANPKIPQPVKYVECVNCGADRNLTSEHCTPKWLADRLRAKPVTARILCGSCNADLKRSLEDPVSMIFTQNAMGTGWARGVVSRWAVKTAAMLAYSTYTRVPASLRDCYRGTDDGTVSVYCLPAQTSSGSALGYIFRVTKFEDKFKDSFLVSMAFGDNFFTVVRSDHEIGPLPLLEKWHPYWSPSTEAQNAFGTADNIVRNIHDLILKTHFGIELHHENFVGSIDDSRRLP